MNFKPEKKCTVVTDNIIKMSKSLMCVRAQYTVEEKFEVPEWIDLDDKKQVIRYEVENHILTITTVDCEIKILPLDGGCVVYNPYPCEVMYEDDDEANDAREEEGDLFASLKEPKEEPKKKKRLLIVEDDEPFVVEDDALKFATLDNPYPDREIEKDPCYQHYQQGQYDCDNCRIIQDNFLCGDCVTDADLE